MRGQKSTGYINHSAQVAVLSMNNTLPGKELGLLTALFGGAETWIPSVNQELDPSAACCPDRPAAASAPLLASRSPFSAARPGWLASAESGSGALEPGREAK